ncbi:MAG: hypothetical protein LBE62_02410 [Azonexus sp.]|nr:hypothetical protein [Azonexus sp.]
MSKFEIFRSDINKVVLKAAQFNTEADALGQYMSVLMLAGILRGRNCDTVERVGNGYRLTNGWVVEVRAVQ